MPYAQHLAYLMNTQRKAHEVCGLTGTVFLAGSLLYHDRDDQALPHRTDPHFARWTPITGPGHAVIAVDGEVPELWQYAPQDFWEELPGELDHPSLDQLRRTEFSEPEELHRRLRRLGATVAVIGSDPAAQDSCAGPTEPTDLLANLDWHRARKSEYEVACIARSVEDLARGFEQLSTQLNSDRSERQLFLEFLGATGHIETELPFSPIVARDRQSAVLHYTTRSREVPAARTTLLLDAGTSHLGYASDVTRTWVADNAPAEFRQLHRDLDKLQTELVAAVRPGLPFVDLHEAAERGIAVILNGCGLLTPTPDEIIARGLVAPFFPHGLGHFLGLQVHDVGGRLASPSGGEVPAPKRFPFLRTTRTLEVDQVVTIEPGIYFIPMLLERHRGDSAFDWALIDQLTPCGGIRIEDDVHITENGVRNLTETIPHFVDRGPGDLKP